MSQSSEEFKNHAIHSTLRELDSIGKKDISGITAEHLAEKKRFLKIVAFVRKALDSADPELVPISTLDAINHYLKSDPIWTNAQDYQRDGNEIYIRHAANQIREHLSSITILFTFNKKETDISKLLEVSLEEFTISIEERKRNLDKKLEELDRRISEDQEKLRILEETIENRRQQTEGQFSEWLKQFSEAQERRNEEYNQWRQQTTTLAAEKIADVIMKGEESLENMVGESKKSLEDLKKGYDSTIEIYLTSAEDKHNKILELYQLTAEDSVAGGYLKSAENEKKDADFWRWASVFFIVATVAWIGFAYHNVGHTIEWAKIAIAFSLTGVLLFGAAYSAQQSNRHRINERRTKWFALEVKAFDPFIYNLQSPDKSDLKKKITEKLFGQNINESDPKIFDEHALKVVLDGLSNAVDKVANLIEKVKS